MAKSKTIKKQHLIRLVAKRSGLSYRKAYYIVEIVIRALIDLIISLEPDERIEIRNFGVFTMKYELPYKDKYHNPQTGEHVIVGAKKRPRFKFSKYIKRECQRI